MLSCLACDPPPTHRATKGWTDPKLSFEFWQVAGRHPFSESQAPDEGLKGAYGAKRTSGVFPDKRQNVPPQPLHLFLSGFDFASRCARNVNSDRDKATSGPEGLLSPVSEDLTEIQSSALGWYKSTGDSFGAVAQVSDFGSAQSTRPEASRRGKTRPPPAQQSTRRSCPGWRSARMPRGVRDAATVHV